MSAVAVAGADDSDRSPWSGFRQAQPKGFDRLNPRVRRQAHSSQVDAERMFRGAFGLFDARPSQNALLQIDPISTRGRPVTSDNRSPITDHRSPPGRQPLRGQPVACLCYVPPVSVSLCYVPPSLAGDRGFGLVARAIVPRVDISGFNSLAGDRGFGPPSSR